MFIADAIANVIYVMYNTFDLCKHWPIEVKYGMHMLNLDLKLEFRLYNAQLRT